MSQLPSGLQRALIRLVVVLIGVVVIRSVLAGVGMLQQRISYYSPVTSMNLIDAFLALVVVGIGWSFRQSICKQLSLLYGDSSEKTTIATGIIGLIIVGYAYYSFSFLASLSLGNDFMWIYNVLFLLLAFAAAFRLVETVLFGLSKETPKRVRKRK